MREWPYVSSVAPGVLGGRHAQLMRRRLAKRELLSDWQPKHVAVLTGRRLISWACLPPKTPGATDETVRLQKGAVNKKRSVNLDFLFLNSVLRQATKHYFCFVVDWTCCFAQQFTQNSRNLYNSSFDKITKVICHDSKLQFHNVGYYETKFYKP